jgi:hypothetical protein
MRRLSAILACLLMLVFGAAACSDDDGDPVDTGQDPSVTEPMDDDMSDDMDEEPMDDEMDDEEMMDDAG